MVNFIDCGRQEFLSRIKGKTVYCFGKGRYLNHFIKEKYGIKIEGIIDNYRYEKLKPILVEDYTVEIFSVEQFKSIYNCNCAVVITCVSFEDVLNQLDSIEEFKDMDCYIEPFIRHYAMQPNSMADTRQIRTRLETERKTARAGAWSKPMNQNDEETIEVKSAINRFQLWEYVSDFNTAGGKARNDVKEIITELEYNIINIHPYEGIEGSERWEWTNKRLIDDWKKCFNVVPEKSVLFLQYTFCQIQQEQDNFLMKLKKEKNAKIILFIHDVEELRYNCTANWEKSDLSGVLRLTDVLIVHNERMKRFFVGKGFCENRIVCLGVFDYLCEKKQQVKFFEKSIIIAGNLERRKSAYIEKLFELSPLKIYLYGHNYTEEPGKDDNIIYRGAFSSRELPQILEGGFGLVWDGEQLETCSGVTGEYLKYNNPHKLSLYLAAGIPVIIWKEAAEASFVEEYGLGLTVSSLFEVNDILNDMKEETYNMYLQNVQVISEKVVKGYYTKRAIEEAENILLIKE